MKKMSKWRQLNKAFWSAALILVVLIMAGATYLFFNLMQGEEQPKEVAEEVEVEATHAPVEPDMLLPKTRLTLENYHALLLNMVKIGEKDPGKEVFFLTTGMEEDEITKILDSWYVADDVFIQYYIQDVVYDVEQHHQSGETFISLVFAITYYEDTVPYNRIKNVDSMEEIYTLYEDTFETGFEKACFTFKKDKFDISNILHLADEMAWNNPLKLPILYKQTNRVEVDESDGLTLLEVSLDYDAPEITKEMQLDAQKQVKLAREEIVNAILAQLYPDGSRKEVRPEDREKALDLIYKEITLRMSFDYKISDALLDAEYNDSPEVCYGRGIYGAFVNGTTVCSGYASGFKSVCDALDIPCIVMLGYAGDADHAWNMVIGSDGKVHHYDATWGDSKKWFATYKDISPETYKKEDRRIYEYVVIPEEFMKAGYEREDAPFGLYDAPPVVEEAVDPTPTPAPTNTPEPTAAPENTEEAENAEGAEATESEDIHEQE